MLSSALKICCVLLFCAVMMAQVGCGMCGSDKGCAVTATKSPCETTRTTCNTSHGTCNRAYSACNTTHGTYYNEYGQTTAANTNQRPATVTVYESRTD
jgi:hypothetical protein